MTDMRLDTLTLRYWQDFELAAGELEYLSEVLIEEESPLTLEGLAQRLMEKRVREEREAWEERKARGVIYQPREVYAEGDRLVFSALGDAIGTVLGLRPGRHPEYAPFDVIQVRMETEGAIREFAAGLSQPHALNIIEVDQDPGLTLDDMTSVSQTLCERYGGYVTPVLLAKLRQSPEFVSFGDEWFLRGFLLPIEEGHLNLAEAVLDLALGFSTAEEILQVLEMPAGTGRGVQMFSLNHALANDERNRFRFAGTKQRMEWCLPRVADTKALRFDKGPAEISRDHILDDVVEIVGHMGPGREPPEGVRRMSHVLTFYDWYWGHLPYDRAARALLVRPLLPGQESTRLHLLHRSSGHVFPVVLHYPKERQSGWWGSAELREFFETRELAPGATIVVEATPTSQTEGLYEIDYYPAPATKLEMLDYEEGGQPVFRRISVRCEIDEDMSLTRSRFSGLETLRLLAENERRTTVHLLAAAFQRVGEKVLRGPAIVYRAGFGDLFVAANIERPSSKAILEAIFDQQPYPCFYRDEEGYYVYDPSRGATRLSKVRLSMDEAILDAGNGNR